jgi:hypothetical protein
MWLYPLPALVSLAMWIYIFLSAPLAGIVFSVAFLAVAVGAFALFEKRGLACGEWRSGITTRMKRGDPRAAR